MNRLGGETSPYLRQHRDNPVDWYPWGGEAFAEARRRNVPVLLSVGYSSCHWCHVMAHECFEDHEVAAEMNARFVNVKVDREERPDIDAIYMEAVQAMTGRGGWPMTAFLAPDGSPFFAGTYFPKAAFLRLMEAVTDVWTNRREDVDTNVEALMGAIRRSTEIQPAEATADRSVIDVAAERLLESFDAEWGGFGSAPKFPSTMNLDLLLRQWMRTGDDRFRHVVVTTLDAMASGGMYDHIGGGFARYSVDEKWLVPHFEKMLYDQALLVRVYTHAAVATGEARFAQVVRETIDYVLREMTHPNGGYFSAEDADSSDLAGHMHEGWFSTWTPVEIRAVLPADLAELAIDWYGITQEGNFEGRTIPTRHERRGLIARPPEVEQARAALLAARAERPHPMRDDKVITEWNALMLSSLAEAALLFDNDEWLAAALRNGEFLVSELRDPTGRWSRSWHEDAEPRARHRALAADLAALVDAFVRLGEVSGERRWLDLAVETADQLLDNHWDPVHGGLSTTPHDGEQLVARQKELLDNATPSANSTAALALLRLAALTGEDRFTHHSERILRLLDSVMRRLSSAAGNALCAVDLLSEGVTEIVVPGPLGVYTDVVRGGWRPHTVLAWGQPADGPVWDGREEGRAYVCRGRVCLTPATSPNELERQLADQRPK
jgi:uncharacterized protein YyaL (SSP411 family)